MAIPGPAISGPKVAAGRFAVRGLRGLPRPESVTHRMAPSLESVTHQMQLPPESVTHQMTPVVNPGGVNQPGQPAAKPPADPRDATYYQNVAANQFKVNQQINADNLQGSSANTALQSALAQLAYQQPRDELALEQRANAAGSLYSSAYGQNLGNLGYQFAGKQGGLQSNFSGTMDRLTAQIAALQQGVPIYNQGQYLAAALRAAAAAAKDPSTGQPLAVKPGTTPAGGSGTTHTMAPSGQENVTHLMGRGRGESVTHRMVPVKPKGRRY